MTLQLPSVSTEGRLRTTAFFAAILRVPRARQVVMTTARPSGMAATPRDTAIYRTRIRTRKFIGVVEPHFQVVDCALCPASMGRIIEMLNVDEPNQNADNRDYFRKHIAKIVELLFQRRRFRDLRCNAFLDVTNGSRSSCQDHQSICMPSDDGGARKEHIDLILLDSLLVGDCPAFFPHALTLS